MNMIMCFLASQHPLTDAFEICALPLPLDAALYLRRGQISSASRRKPEITAEAFVSVPKVLAYWSSNAMFFKLFLAYYCHKKLPVPLTVVNTNNRVHFEEGLPGCFTG
jgi:hypothetical protein